jgi:hypothetical protein
MMPHRALVQLRRSAAMLVGVAAIVGLGGCAAQLGSMAPSADMLLPHSVLLKPPSLDRGSFDVSVYKGAASDTAQRPFTKVVVSEHDVPGQSGKAVVLSEWGPPQSRKDSLVVDPRSLQPLEERYWAHNVRYDYSFDNGSNGTRVLGTVRRANQAPQRVNEAFIQPVFALNEVGQLVCSLDHYEAGMTEIVPVFSEMDEELQRDTLTVLRGKTLPGHAPGWVVRWAAPATTTDYVVDASTRRIVDAVATRRDTGAETRYRYPEANG